MVYISDLLRELNLDYRYLGSKPETGVCRFISQELDNTQDCLVLSVIEYQQLLVKHTGKICHLIILVDSFFPLNLSFDSAGLDIFLVITSKSSEKIITLLNREEQQLINQQQQIIQDTTQHLMALLASEVTINELANYAYAILDNPLIITDESYKVLAYTKGVNVTDPTWQNIVENTYSSFLLVEQTNLNDFWQRLAQAKTPLFVDADVFKGSVRRAVAQMTAKDEPKGYIALLEIKQKITHFDLVLLQLVANTISIKVHEIDNVLRITGRLKNEFISSLLLNSNLDREMTLNRAQSLGFQFSQWHCVLGVQLHQLNANLESMLISLKRELTVCVKFIASTQRQQQGYYILSVETKEQLIALIPKLEMLLLKYKLDGILSLPVNDLLKLHDNFVQIERIRRLLPKFIRPNPSLYPYATYAVLDLVAGLSQEKKAALPSRSYLVLQRHDQDEGTQLIKTLRTFFACNQNVSATSNQLFVHRNTINYRLGCIRRLLSDDFDEPLIRLHLYLSILADDIG